MGRTSVWIAGPLRLVDSAVKSTQLSWRDPDGFVVRDQGRILRAVALKKADQVRALLDSPWVKQLIADRSIPETRELVGPPPAIDAPHQWLWLEHEVLSFPCYPHEITAMQLFDAGQLTLQIALEAARNGWVLKDASAWNVLFSKGHPVFVDLLSFDREEITGNWIAYGQFVRHFLIPLLLYRSRGITPAETFLAHRDGITPERAYTMLGRVRRLSPLALELVVLPKLLSRSGGRMIEAQTEKPQRRVGAEVGQDILLRTLARLSRQLERLRPDRAHGRSTWSDYEQDRDHYSDVDLAAKRAFVREHLGASETVLDLGCNAGEFSLLAADGGRTVVGTDFDHGALMRFYARIRGQRMAITPVMLDIARPTPAVGWGNTEVGSFLDRAEGQFDCVLVLGLVHHLLVSERATLPMLVALLERMSPRRVIFEWVDPKDRRFRQIAGLNAKLYEHLNTAQVEEHFGRRFRLLARTELPSAARVMYLWGR